MQEYTLKANNQTINTDFAGTIALLDYFNYAKQFKDRWINLNLDSINFIDANLSAFLYAIIFYLRKTRGVKTFVDFQSLKSDLNVLIRNGFTNYIAGRNLYSSRYDPRDTTIPLKDFYQDDVDPFVDYIERDFLRQRGLTKIETSVKKTLEGSYMELFDNVGLHANTEDPVFVCGQYYPKNRVLNFTLVDLGDGFLKKIKEYTAGDENITKASNAIDWALKGNSTKKGIKGGTGLKNIFWFCFKNEGRFHIVTDDCYYDLTNRQVTTHKIPHNFKGATIHLIFRFLSE